nr:thioredoxin-like domain-containing protein [uncultured Capnocytophaga sp.]
MKFVGIDIGQDKNQWRRQIQKSDKTDQYHSINFMDLSQKFLINNINKSLIIDKNGRIISAFEDIFSPNLEKILLLKES